VQVEFLSGQQAGAIAKRARQLLQAGEITHHQFALLEVLLWRCRKHGQAIASASYSALQRLTHEARETVSNGLRRFQELDIIRKVKSRVHVSWQGRIASRQATNVYVFLAPPTEFAGRTVNREIEIQIPDRPSKEVLKAQEALARRRAEMELRLLGKGRDADSGGRKSFLRVPTKFFGPAQPPYSDASRHFR
jgi:hypothetical protein